MDFEWDEAKRLSNVAKHGIDFSRATLIFRSGHVVRSARLATGERRWIAIGQADDVLIAVIYTLRGDAVRIISARRARDDERREYRALYG